MNILILTPRFPYPPIRGDCLRAWGELEYLAHRHRVWLACVDHHPPHPEYLEHVRRSCQDVAVAVRSTRTALLRGGWHLLTGGSLSEGYFTDAALERQVRAWAEQVEFDAVLVFSPEMARYADCVPHGRVPLVACPPVRSGAAATPCRARVRRVLDMNDVESFKWQTYARRAAPPLRWLYAWEARRLLAAERRWVRACDVCLLVNERERRKLEQRVQVAQPSPAVAVVRTGVDLSSYVPAGAPAPAVGPVCNRSDPIVGFIGSLSYPPNVRAVNWFGREVWPRIRQAVPQARWLIVGSRPRRSVRRFARLPGVTVTGFVEDIRPCLAKMRVFVCPVDGEIGVQTKLIEAMAAARPAVVTPDAATGIDYECGATAPGCAPFLIADSAEHFTNAVVRLLQDDALARRLGARARVVAESNYCAAEQYALVERWLAGDDPAPRSEPEAQARDKSPTRARTGCKPVLQL